MIATEQVAREKVCPFMTNQHNWQGSQRETKCKASECMAWKWASGFSPEELEARKEWNPNPAVPKGYCGA